MDGVMAAVGRDDAGAAVNSTLRQVGGAIAIAVPGSILSASYARALRPALTAQLGRHLPSGGAVQAAAGTAFLHSMSDVMLTCAAITALAAVTSLRYLPGRVTPGPARQPPATASPPAGTRR